MLTILDGLLTTLTYIAVSFLLFFIGKIAYQLFHPRVKVAYELVENDNLAFAFAHVGYFIGLLLSIGSVMLGESEGLVNDLMGIGIYGLLSIVLLNLSLIINDKIILSNFDLKKEIFDDKNVGTGIVEGANAIATGLVVMGAITGEGYGELGPIVNVLVYWILGQVILFVTSKIYNLMTSYDVHYHIERGNIAVAVGYSGAIIAIGNLINNALAHDFDSWMVTVQDVGFNVIVGFAFLPIARFLTDKILLPGQKLTDEIVNQEDPNVGAAIVEAFAYVGGSMLIVWAL
ncbi:DUF350 domain-containing protein [Cyclobacteriaceae bacterium]|nr:DUF350 domain-containing protein [Cyclobacteriaceae bacterium]|tara:strand:+ start:2797 stop:3660 length:864 start_codon:yes stop_codon:yes gene_type:complete